MTSVQDIKNWYDQGVKDGAKYVIVACDSFDYTDFPVYVMEDESFTGTFTAYNDSSQMLRVMEVYDLSVPFLEQKTLNGFAWGLPK